MARTLPILFSILALTSAIEGCSRAEAAPMEVTTIPKRVAGERNALVVAAESFATRACDCGDRSCSDAVAKEFVAFRNGLGRDDDTALDSAAKRIHNCQALVHAR